MITQSRFKYSIHGEVTLYRFCLLFIVSSIYKTGWTLKCRNALCLDFTALTHLCFSVVLYM